MSVRANYNAIIDGQMVLPLSLKIFYLRYFVCTYLTTQVQWSTVDNTNITSIQY